MKLTCSLPLVLFLLLVISQGVFSNPPSGNCCMSVAFHSQMSICAVSGSSVVISCSFNNQTCNFIFEIENPNKTMEGKFEINLTVTDLTVLVPLPVIEGGDAKLLCMSVCNVTGDPKVIWRKNGQVVTELSFGTCLTIGVSVSAAGVLVLVCVVNWISVKKRSGGHKKRDNGHLFTLQPQAPRESGRESDVQYTTVQFKRRESPETEGDDVQCASVQFKMAGVAQGSPDLPEGELSVIYSSVARNGSPTKPSSFPGE
ncbi:uncharacterized protein LOC121719571 isoform X3 [Alosa sapidissima]|uniref:uncharacterized protein LOC121719571 isoform X3 n=1 Tax=Alosa sapidissima TaxID=34773 RepID=UPI001C098E29|nr:uncharacterized protein LOC121719571 isoform X3 [Alosa sapidissima]